MSNRAASFVEQWVSENAVKPVEGAPAGDDSEARLRFSTSGRSASLWGLNQFVIVEPKLPQEGLLSEPVPFATGRSEEVLP
jgi:hypothetical protein